MDLTNPQQWNAYTYSNNNPVTYSDPTGLIPSCGNDGQVTCPSSPPPGEIPVPDPDYKPDPVKPPGASCPVHPACDPVDGADDGLSLTGAAAGGITAFGESSRYGTWTLKNDPDEAMKSEAGGNLKRWDILKRQNPAMYHFMKLLLKLNKMRWFKIGDCRPNGSVSNPVVTLGSLWSAEQDSVP